jgi:ligand-binding SRPBCC domain-containing protein
MRVLEERVEIEAPAASVWQVLADFGGVADWAPYMRSSHLVGEQPSGVGTRRAMRHAWGFRFEEAVTQWHEGKGFSFDVLRAPFPMLNVKEAWVMARENGYTVVSTQVRYGMRLGLIGRALDGLLVCFLVRREMRAGLRGLKQHVESRHPQPAAAAVPD